VTSPAGAEVPASVSAEAATARADHLHQRYRRDVLAYCVRKLRSREEGEDAAQTVFLNAYRSLAKGTEPRYERAWLFAIAEHVVVQQHRTNSRRLRFEVPVDVDDLAYLAVAPSPDDAPDLTGLVDALSEMPALERRALVLRELRGFTYKEVASELGVSGAVVETLLIRGRRRLADRMHDLRRTGKRALGVCLPWPSLQSLFGSGAALKGIAGLASVAIFTAALPLHHAVTKAPPRATAASRPAAAPRRPARILRPSSSGVAPSVSVVRRAHTRASSRQFPAATPPSPTIPVETPPATASTADGGLTGSQPATVTAVAVSEEGVSAPTQTAGLPGQSERSLESDPKGPPPTADRGSSADNGGQSPHGEPG
jgi:RNA polymerase sigma-70 factor, ECF subfamily